MNNLIINIFILSFLIPVYLQAQSVTWTRYYNPSEYTDRGIGIIENPDTTYVLLSNTSLGISLLKVDKYGNLIWQNLYDSLGSGSRSLIKTNDNGFVIAGQSSSPVNSMQLIKTDSSGRIMWVKRYFRPGKQSRAFSVKETHDYGFIMCGEIYPNAPNEVYVVKTDYLGNLEWERQYIGIATYDILQADEGYYYTVGLFVLRKLDSLGNELWTQPVSASLRILQSSDDYLYTSGGLEQFSLSKIDTSGKIIFERNYFSQAYCRGMCINSKGEIILTGSKSTDTGTVKQNLDVLIAIFDTLGNIRNSNLISLGKTPQGLVTQEEPYNIISTIDQGFILCGTTDYPTGNEFFDNVLVIKTDSIGRTSPISTITNNYVKLQEFQLYQNYPNPFNPFTTIKYSLNVKSHIKLFIIDINGKIVKTLINKDQITGEHKQVIDGSNLPSGVYFVIMENNISRKVKKILLIK